MLVGYWTQMKVIRGLNYQQLSVTHQLFCHTENPFQELEQ